VNVICKVKRGTYAVAEKTVWKFTISPTFTTLQHQLILWMKKEMHKDICELRVPLRVWVLWV
jgi:hypothetical protein